MSNCVVTAAAPNRIGHATRRKEIDVGSYDSLLCSEVILGSYLVLAAGFCW